MFGRFVGLIFILSVGAVAVWIGHGWGGWLIFSALLGQMWIIGSDLWERRINEIDSRAHLVGKRMAFGIAASQWDAETRHFLAREWPEMGVEFGEEALEYVLDKGVNTGILIPFLRAFLQDSTEASFADLRTYNDDKGIQERFNVSRETVRLQWRKCTEFLEAKGYLREGSMAGNRTWQWTTSEHYHLLRRRYLNRAPLEAMK